MRLTKEEKEFIDRLIAEEKYSSVSEALKAGLYELMREYRSSKLPWSTRAEVRRYFAQKGRTLKGLEALHDEED